jgi:starch-binding outer membrane protein, SusD/RagB family
MFKRINKVSIYLVIISAVLFSSCKKDLLNPLPNDRLSTDLFWKSETDARLAANAVYPFLDGTAIFIRDGITDIGHKNILFDPEAVIENGTYDALNSRIFTEWSDAYGGVSAANYFLANVDKLQGSSPAVINQLKGEVKTIRAYQYIKLVGLFGDVPLVTKPLTLAEGKEVTRATAEEVYNFVDAELTEAAGFLPTTYPAADKGRITKGAALALKARANLFRGRFQQAADAAKQVMDLNVYSIYPQYARLFSYAAENNSEVILDKQFVKDTYSNNVFQLMAPYSQKTSNTAYVPTKVLVDAYPMANGLAITDPASGFNPMTPYAGRDPRLKASIFVPGDILPDGKVYNSVPSSGTPDAWGNTYLASGTGYGLKKYINTEDFANPSNSGINIILVRYAEVLLTYAEAKTELNQIDQSVLSAVNLVRQRADVNLPALSGSYTQLALRDIIRRERTVELAFEGLRLFDIRRWKIAENVMTGPVNGLTYVENGQLKTIQVQAYQRVFDKSRHYLWPVPQKERELNPNLTQNPGW